MAVQMGDRQEEVQQEEEQLGQQQLEISQQQTQEHPQDGNDHASRLSPASELRFLEEEQEKEMIKLALEKSISDRRMNSMHSTASVSSHAHRGTGTERSTPLEYAPPDQERRYRNNLYYRGRSDEAEEIHNQETMRRYQSERNMRVAAYPGGNRRMQMQYQTAESMRIYPGRGGERYRERMQPHASPHSHMGRRIVSVDDAQYDMRYSPPTYNHPDRYTGVPHDAFDGYQPNFPPPDQYAMESTYTSPDGYDAYDVDFDDRFSNNTSRMPPSNQPWLHPSHVPHAPSLAHPHGHPHAHPRPHSQVDPHPHIQSHPPHPIYPPLQPRVPHPRSVPPSHMAQRYMPPTGRAPTMPSPSQRLVGGNDSFSTSQSYRSHIMEEERRRQGQGKGSVSPTVTNPLGQSFHPSRGGSNIAAAAAPAPATESISQEEQEQLERALIESLNDAEQQQEERRSSSQSRIAEQLNMAGDHLSKEEIEQIEMALLDTSMNRYGAGGGNEGVDALPIEQNSENRISESATMQLNQAIANESLSQEEINQIERALQESETEANQVQSSSHQARQLAAEQISLAQQRADEQIEYLRQMRRQQETDLSNHTALTSHVMSDEQIESGQHQLLLPPDARQHAEEQIEMAKQRADEQIEYLRKMRRGQESAISNPATPNPDNLLGPNNTSSTEGNSGCVNRARSPGDATARRRAFEQIALARQRADEEIERLKEMQRRQAAENSNLNQNDTPVDVVQIGLEELSVGTEIYDASTRTGTTSSRSVMNHLSEKQIDLIKQAQFDRASSHHLRQTTSRSQVAAVDSLEEDTSNYESFDEEESCEGPLSSHGEMSSQDLSNTFGTGDGTGDGTGEYPVEITANCSAEHLDEITYNEAREHLDENTITDTGEHPNEITFDFPVEDSSVVNREGYFEEEEKKQEKKQIFLVQDELDEKRGKPHDADGNQIKDRLHGQNRTIVVPVNEQRQPPRDVLQEDIRTPERANMVGLQKGKSYVFSNSRTPSKTLRLKLDWEREQNKSSSGLVTQLSTKKFGSFMQSIRFNKSSKNVKDSAVAASSSNANDPPESAVADPNGSPKTTTVGELMDSKARFQIGVAIRGGMIDKVNRMIRKGKGSEIYHAVTAESDDSNTEDSGKVNGHYDLAVAIKIFACGDPQYWKTSFRSLNDQEQMDMWAKKEFQHLKRAKQAGVPVPTPIFQRNNIVFMRFLGRDGTPAPQLKDLELRRGHKKWKILFWQVMDAVKRLFLNALLVHGDLNESNVLIAPVCLMNENTAIADPSGKSDNDSGYDPQKEEVQIALIDFVRTVDSRHPDAMYMLRQDLKRIGSFFYKHTGFRTLTVDDMVEFVTKSEEKHSNRPLTPSNSMEKTERRGSM